MTNTAWRNVVRGVALGDAWGDPNEFASIRSLVRDNPVGPDIPGRLRITDDTQMTLYLASALDETWDQDMATVKAAIVSAYLEYRDDPDNNRAPGCTVMGSLGRLKKDGSNWQDATSPTSDGSGTVMRTSPTAFLPEDRWVGVTAFAAALTHGSANGVAAAILNAAILREILAGRTKAGTLLREALILAQHAEELGLTDVGEWLDGYPIDLRDGFVHLERWVTKALAVLPELRADPWAQDSDPSLVITETWLRGGGWRAPETLVIALLATDMLAEEPWNALRRAVTTDGDSDTIGAVAGALIGAAFPMTFSDNWEWLRERFEPRYVRWIETEADEYPLENFPVPGRFKRVLKGLLARG